jgi:outer membrane protein
MKFTRIHLLSILIAISIVFILLQSFVFSRNKIVYVDSAKLLNGYKAMVEAKREFEKKQDVWNANIDSLTRTVRISIASYEKTAATGTEKERQLAKELIGGKQRQLYDYQNAVKQNAAEEQQKTTQSVLSTVNSYLMRYGKKNNYKLILIASGGNIAYADSDIDITDKVVEDLNKEYSLPVKQ